VLAAERDRLALYRHAMDDATVGITIAEADGDQPLVYANAAFERITGYDSETVIGSNCRFLQGPGTDQRAVAELGEAVAAGRPTTVELLNYRADGEPFWNRVRITPVEDENGEPTHFLGFQEDVTDRIELERREREEREMLEGLFEASPAGIVVFDEEGRITRANEAAERVLGLERSTVAGRAYDDPGWWVREKAGRPAPPSELPVTRALAGETVTGTELGITVDGERRWLVVNAVPWHDDEGTVDGALVAVRDDTDRRARARERERLLERFGTVQELADIGAWEFDARTGRWSLSDQSYDILGVDLEAFDPDGTALLERYHPEDRGRVRAATADALATGEPYDIEVRLRADGELRWVRIDATPRVEDGEVVGLLGGVQDVTERKARERRLTVLDRVLRHNIRNKLNVVLAHADALGAGPTDDEVALAGRHIRNAGRELVAMTEKVRRFESAVRPAESTVDRTDVASRVHGVVDEFRTENPETPVDERLPASAWAQTHEAVGLAVGELLENAAVHAGGSGIEVSIEDRPDEGIVLVQVADDGPGLPEMERRVLAEGSERPLSHMEGIGLWLVNWTVTSSGGSLAVDTGGTEGTNGSGTAGTVVEMRFPRADPPAGGGDDGSGRGRPGAASRSVE
jgi:PAS domain S-box-containing protein